MVIELIALGLLVALVVFWRAGNSLRSLLIAWLVAVTPSTLGLIHYSYQYTGSNRYAAYIAASIISFMIGYFGYYQVAGYKLVNYSNGAANLDDSFQALRRPVILVAIIAFLANIFLIMDVVVSGIDVTDLTSIRTEVVSRESASLLARLASVTSWACFFCLAYAVYYRNRLSRVSLLVYFALGLGTVLVSLFSAGRQALLQTILLMVFVDNFRRRAEPDARFNVISARILLIFAIVFLLFYVTINRSSGDYGLARVDILLRLFQADLSPEFEEFLSYFPLAIGDFIVESALYVSHSVPLFSVFADIEFPERYIGQMSFPFFFRQLEPITGLNSQLVYLTKIDYLNASGLFGVGWNTALSQTSMDFGMAGTAVFFALNGAIANFWDVRAKYRIGFVPSVMSSIFMISAIYTPFLLLFSDTPFIILFLFLTVLTIFLPKLERRARDRKV